MHCVLHYLLRVIRELNFVEDLGAVLLNCINLYLVRWKLSGLHSSTKTMTNVILHTVNILSHQINNVVLVICDPACGLISTIGLQ